MQSICKSDADHLVRSEAPYPAPSWPTLNFREKATVMLKSLPFHFVHLLRILVFPSGWIRRILSGGSAIAPGGIPAGSAEGRQSL